MAAGVPWLLGSGDLSGSTPGGEAAASDDALSELLPFLPAELDSARLDAAASICSASPLQTTAGAAFMTIVLGKSSSPPDVIDVVNGVPEDDVAAIATRCAGKRLCYWPHPGGSWIRLITCVSKGMLTQGS